MALPPDKDPHFSEIGNVEKLTEIHEECLKTGRLISAVQVIDRLAEVCSELNDDRPVTNAAYTCYVVLSPEYKYENLVNQYWARLISDTAHYFIYLCLRRKSYHQSYSPSMTLLTPHRRRQLAKTMNPEPRIFGYGLNAKHCLAVDTPDLEYIGIPTEINIPPVYQMRLSSNHSVFWLHDGRFFGAGDARMFLTKMSSKQRPILYKTPVELDFKIKKGEWITGFKALEHGTLFETNARWYFVGDYPKSRVYLLTLHKTTFTLAKDMNPPSSNYWISESRPKQTCLHVKLDDLKNLAQMRILTTTYMIKVYPSYWTELNPGHVKRRPVCFLLEGVEVKDVRIDNIASSTIWVLHNYVLYHGKMRPMLKDGNDGDEMNLDNYILLVELAEFRTPSPFVCNEVAANNNHGALIRLGDVPYECFDHLEVAEQRFRGNVHKLMFETMDIYKKFTYLNSNYTSHKKQEITNFTLELLLKEMDEVITDEQMNADLTSDWCGRIQKKDRYCNFFSFLGYVSMPRLPQHPPKCFANDIDMMIDSENEEYLAKYRMKQLFEEFERVNYPGTEVWKPVEFLKQHPDPYADTMGEGAYRAAAMRWAVNEFRHNIIAYKNSGKYIPEDKTNQLITRYLLNTIWYATDSFHVINKINDESSSRDDMQVWLDSMERIIPDDEVPFATMNPGKILENRIREGLLRDPKDLEEPLNITMTFLMQHRDPKYKPTRYKTQTCIRFLMAQNPYLLQFVDQDKILDLNKVYPNDIKLHRLIVHTHFYGHGTTDMEGLEKYRKMIKRIGLEFDVTDKYMKRATPHYRGYLCARTDMPNTPIASYKRNTKFDITLETSDGKTIYCHSMIRTLFSTLPPDEPLPNTLTAELMMCALNGLMDRLLYETFQVRTLIEVAAWYAEAKMHEAFVDLLKQCVIDAMTNDSSDIMILVQSYPTIMQRLIAQYRPGIIFWHRPPIPRPRIQHIKIIMEMLPKNEHGRETRLPKKQIMSKTDKLEDSVFRQIDPRELRKYYMYEQERRIPRFTPYFENDFPLPYTIKPFKANGDVDASPRIRSKCPDLPDKRRIIKKIAAADRVDPFLPPQSAAPTYKPEEQSEERKKLYQTVQIVEDMEDYGKLYHRKVPTAKKTNKKK